MNAYVWYDVTVFESQCLQLYKLWIINENENFINLGQKIEHWNFKIHF